MSKRYTAKRIREGVRQCISYCENTGYPPAEYVLHMYLDIPEEELSKIAAAGGEIGRAAAEWQEFKTFYWLRHGREDSKQAQFAMFNLKEPSNGGYGSSGEGRSEIVLRLEGAGGPEAFK